MPNHVKNVVVIDGLDRDSLDELMRKIRRDTPPDGSEKNALTIDFDKIKPMPKALDIENGSETLRGTELYLTWINPHVGWYGETNLSEGSWDWVVRMLNAERRFGEYKTALSSKEIRELTTVYDEGRLTDIGKRCVDNIITYGATNWYHWRTSPKNWNTKWNAYDFKNTGADNIIEFSTAWSAPHPVIKTLSCMFPSAEISHCWADEDLSCANCGKHVYIAGQLVADLSPHSARARAEFSSDLWCADLADECGMCINGTETDYVRPEDICGELCVFGGKYGMWTNHLLRPEDVPKGLFLYYLSGKEEPCYVSPCAPKEDFMATVITKVPVYHRGHESATIDPDTDIKLTGSEISCSEFMERDRFRDLCTHIYDERGLEL